MIVVTGSHSNSCVICFIIKDMSSYAAIVDWVYSKNQHKDITVKWKILLKNHHNGVYWEIACADTQLLTHFKLLFNNKVEFLSKPLENAS